MKPLFQPQLIHDPFGDPGLYVEFLFEKRALLFDLGDLTPLSPRKILRITDVFVTHTHMDHFNGFDWMVRICLGRPIRLRLFGPPGFIQRVEHKLFAYTWNLVANYENEFTLEVTEVHPGILKTTAFRCRDGFCPGETEEKDLTGGVLLDEETFRVRTVVLDHKIPCLAFAVEEKVHINVLKSRLGEMGLAVGSWLKELKAAVIRGAQDDSPFRAWWKEGGRIEERWVPVGTLKAEILRMVAGQRITYVVDTVYHEENARKIVNLAHGSDTLFIEASFLQEDARRAAEKYHLTARQAGALGRMAGVKRLVPFHFSPKYKHQEAQVLQEVQEAFTSDRGVMEDESESI